MNIIFIILAVYFILLLLVVWYFAKKESVEAYFLNKRKTSLWLMTFANVATVVGAGATVAVVSEVYNSGISYGIALPISFIVGMISLGIVAKKIKIMGDKYKAYSIVDFFHKRFDKKNKVLAGVIQLFLLIMWIALQTTAVATLAHVLIGVNYTLAIIVAIGITILYTTVGGLKADILTDFIQFWVILIVFIIMGVIGYIKVENLHNLIIQLPQGHLNIFAFGGVGWFIGAIVLSGFVYLANTAHWQRIFSAKNEKIARNSFFLSIPFMITLSLLVLFFGLLAAGTLSDINQDTAFFSLMYTMLPPWLIGLGFAAILAVAMSSIDSVVIGGSTIIYREIFKNKSEGKKQVFYARLITASFGILGGFVAFLIPSIITLSLFVTYLTLIFVPAIFAGLYAKTSANASFYSILISFILLLILFPIVGKNTFIITTTVAIAIILFYDKLFKNSNLP
ncbi:sodium:solute symporter family protein [Candidatus Woesearchaeota archaeon]|nr:MAG: sodium:solute symporter family protein [Candidatus Woesearchaeota archaeon]